MKTTAPFGLPPSPATRCRFSLKGAMLAGLFIAALAPAQTITTLRTFSGDTNSANLVQTSDGTIYGVTRPSSANSTANGYVFKLQPDGSGYQTVYSFPAGTSGVARLPDFSFIAGRDGAFYGTGEFGGTSGYGMLYRVSANGTGTLLRSFTAGGAIVVNDGGAPRGGLVHASDGFIYGATTTGTGTGTSINDRNGVIYRIAPDGSAYSIIYSFNNGIFSANGGGPNSLIQGRDGNLYGTALGGPAASGGTGGVVFTLKTDGTGFTVLKAFGNQSIPIIHDPLSPLVHASDGYLYGTTRAGGATGDGVIYRLQPNGTGFEVIYSFSDLKPSLGLEPTGGFFQGRDGSLYGRTNAGGTTNNHGVIYKIRTDGTGFRVLANFSSSRSGYVNGLIQGLDGALYATTENTIVKVVEAPGLEIAQQPASQTVAPGGTATFSVTAATATSYQWKRNGTNINGATLPTLMLNNVSAANNGTYSVVATNARDSVTSAGAVLLVEVPNPGRLINLSVRTDAGAGSLLFAGFAIGGSGQKKVLIRAVGPTLGDFGVTGVLPDPRLALFSSTAQVATNEGWNGASALSDTFSQLGAFALPTTSADAALLFTQPVGGYTAQVSSRTGKTGVVLFEAYDADGPTSSARFVNLSARSFAGTGAQTLIAGFAISGNVPKTLLIRGVGPRLGFFGVPGVLTNPRLELHTTINNQDVVVASNAGWGGNAALAAVFPKVGAFELPADSEDAALLVTLAPGTYTAQVAGENGATGVALIEIYEVP